MKYILPLAMILMLLGGAAYAGDTITGQWSVSWQNGTPNELSLRKTGGGFSGFYINDNGDACPIQAKRFNNTNEFLIQCPKWNIKCRVTSRSNGRWSGNYLAYGNAIGTFVMTRH